MFHTNDFPGGSDDKASAYNAGDLGSILGWGRSPEEGNGNPLQYSCLENSMDRGDWQAIVYGVAKSQTKPSGFTFTLEGTGGRRCKDKQLGGCWSSPGRSELGGVR